MDSVTSGIVQAILTSLMATVPHKAEGSMVVLDYDNAIGAHSSFNPKTEVVIFIDYMDDGLSASQANDLSNWYNTIGGQLDQMMWRLGYKAIENNDGSGNGLYYGTTLYRRVRQIILTEK